MAGFDLIVECHLLFYFLKLYQMAQELNPCKCGSTKVPDLDSDLMVPCWGVNCYDCGQFQHGINWDRQGAIDKWNQENPKIKINE